MRPPLMAGHMAQLDLRTEYSGRPLDQRRATIQVTVRVGKELIRITELAIPRTRPLPGFRTAPSKPRTTFERAAIEP
jgi:hypothetical protein